MRPLRIVLSLSALALLLAASSAEAQRGRAKQAPRKAQPAASGVALGLGADYLRAVF
jgi:Flp pilus assembly protein CpaB